jgi:hypothetical protein
MMKAGLFWLATWGTFISLSGCNLFLGDPILEGVHAAATTSALG